jgi:hypothetical protein
MPRTTRKPTATTRPPAADTRTTSKPRRQKAKTTDCSAMAALEFEALPSGDALGDPVHWAKKSEGFRVALVFASATLSKDAKALRAWAEETIRSVDSAAAWMEMIATLSANAKNARVLARVLESAMARATIAASHIAA